MYTKSGPQVDGRFTFLGLWAWLAVAASVVATVVLIWLARATPCFCCRYDIDYVDYMSIPHFLIPFICANLFPPIVVRYGVWGFEFVEPGLYELFGKPFTETRENQTGDIIIGWGGILLGYLLLAVDVRAVRGARRRRETRGRCLA
ncbi:MAG TPA: hypothetical protein VMV94_14005 [Phycisphaerae bacterium]|nr:hypothetical protein [Phycisphaerae bacterium]